MTFAQHRDFRCKHSLVGPQGCCNVQATSACVSHDVVTNACDPATLSLPPTEETHLPLDCLEQALHRLTFADVAAAAATCPSWRRFVLSNESLLASLPLSRAFPRPRDYPATPSVTCHGNDCCSHVSRLLRIRSSVSLNSTHVSTNHDCMGDRDSASSLSSSATRWSSRGRQQRVPVPAVLLAAADAGNMGAMLSVAGIMEERGEMAKAIEMRKKAGRAGHQLSQYLLGEAYYRGDHGCPRDSEEALAWLLRAARTRREGDGDGEGGEQVCAAAALLLGYMYLDGEGTSKICNEEAVKWLTVARNYGCKEAETTLGWMWNTGQY